MNDWLNKPWVIRVISLILALLLFTIISFDNQDQRGDALRLDLFSSSQETQVVDDVPVNVEMDDRYVVSGVPDTATVTLEGTVSVVQSTATQRNFDVFVDLEGLEPGTHSVPLQYEGISDRLEVSIDPEEIEVTIEEKATADFEVTADYTNEELLAPGYELEEATIEPGTVSITSSKSVIDRISVVKAFVDVEGIEESVEIEDVQVRVYDSEGNELSARVEPETVNVTINVDNPSAMVPVQIETTGSTPDDVEVTSITPETEEVEVFAAESDLDDITEIVTEAIDLSTVTEDSSIEVELRRPDTVRLIRPNTITINIEVDQQVEETYEDVAITIEDVDSAYTASFVDPENGAVDITATGFESVLNDIDGSDFTLRVDASNLPPGEHDVPVEVDAPNDIDASLANETVIIQIE